MDPNFEREILARSIKRLAIYTAGIIALLIALLIATSCSAPAQAILPEGKILERDGNRFLVVWPDHGDKPHGYAWNWVYQPGMGWMDIEDLEVIIVIRPKER